MVESFTNDEVKTIQNKNKGSHKNKKYQKMKMKK